MMTLNACRDVALVAGATLLLAACQPSATQDTARAEAAGVVAAAQNSAVSVPAKSYGTAEYLVRKKIDVPPTMVATSGPNVSAAQVASEKAVNPAAMAAANHASVARETSAVRAVDIRR